MPWPSLFIGPGEQMWGVNSISPSQCPHSGVASPENSACSPSSQSFMGEDDWKRRKRPCQWKGWGGGVRDGRMDGWMDGQIKHRQQPLNRGLTTPARRDVMENRFGSDGLKSIQTKGDSGRMEVEDSGCQDCCWDGVRSHFSSVITLSVSPPLSSPSNYCHNEADPFLRSYIWPSGCKVIHWLVELCSYWLIQRVKNSTGCRTSLCWTECEAQLLCEWIKENMLVCLILNIC